MFNIQLKGKTMPVKTKRVVKKLVEQQPVLTDKIEKLVMLKDSEKVLQQEIKALQQEVIDEMTAAELKTTSTTLHEGKKDRFVKVTLVRGETVTINDESLRKQLTVAQWNKVTHRVIDHKKLEEAMAEDVVSPVVVANCSITRPRSPYIRVTS